MRFAGVVFTAAFAAAFLVTGCAPRTQVMQEKLVKTPIDEHGVVCYLTNSYERPLMSCVKVAEVVR